MSLEKNDASVPQTRQGDDTHDDKPGYPPPGYQENKQKLTKAENQVKASENPDGHLDDEIRLTEILPWVTDKLSDCEPHDLAAEACLQMEKDEHEAGDFLYRVTDENPDDIRSDVQEIIAETNNRQKIATLAQDTKKKDTAIARKEAGIKEDKRSIDVEKAKTPTLMRAAKRRETIANLRQEKEAATKADQRIIEENYPEPLMSEHGGSIGAIEALMGMVKSPATRARLNNVLRTVTALQKAVPGKADLITGFIDRSNLNLGAESMVAVFADFTAHVDSSDEFTEEEKTKIHKTIGSVQTGDNATISDMSENLDRKTVVFDEDGNPVETEDPAFEGEENGLEVRDGIVVYVENGEKIMKNLQTGQFAELDASLGGVEHTRALMEFWQSQNSLLAVGVENAWGLPLAKEHRQYTIKELHQFQRYMQLLQGGARGLSPVVQRDHEQNRFAKNFLIVSQRGNAAPFTHSQQEMEQSRADLGLEERLDSARNENILEAIGNFLNAPANSGLTGEDLYLQLQKHLHGLFPSHVEAPGANSTIGADSAAA